MMSLTEMPPVSGFSGAMGSTHPPQLTLMVVAGLGGVSSGSARPISWVTASSSGFSLGVVGVEVLTLGFCLLSTAPPQPAEV